MSMRERKCFEQINLSGRPSSLTVAHPPRPSIFPMIKIVSVDETEISLSLKYIVQFLKDSKKE